jgi:hypothetical protein
VLSRKVEGRQAHTWVEGSNRGRVRSPIMRCPPLSHTVGMLDPERVAMPRLVCRWEPEIRSSRNPRVDASRSRGRHRPAYCTASGNAPASGNESQGLRNVPADACDRVRVSVREAPDKGDICGPLYHLWASLSRWGAVFRGCSVFTLQRRVDRASASAYNALGWRQDRPDVQSS